MLAGSRNPREILHTQRRAVRSELNAIDRSTSTLTLRRSQARNGLRSGVRRVPTQGAGVRLNVAGDLPHPNLVVALGPDRWRRAGQLRAGDDQKRQRARVLCRDAGDRVVTERLIMQFTSCSPPPSPALAKCSMSSTSVSSATTLHPIASALPMTGSAPITCPRVAVWSSQTESRSCGSQMLCSGIASAIPN